MIENFFLSQSEFIRYKLFQREGENTPIVFVGSWKLMIEEYETFAEQLQDTTLLFIECRGMGLSTCRKPFTIDDCSQDVINLITYLFNGRQVCIVGFSLGGNIALKAVSINESLFSKIVVFATKLKTYPEIDFQSCKVVFSSEFDEAFKTIGPTLFTKEWLKQDDNIIYSKYSNKYKQHYHLFTKLRHEKELIHTAYFGHHPVPTFNISIPILAVFGEEDVSVPPAYGTLFKDNFSNASTRVLKKSGHLMWISNPKESIDIINDFLKSNGDEKVNDDNDSLVSSTPSFWFDNDARSVLLNALKNIKKLFDLYDITYWISWGTLLGAVRREGFIPWDYDVDIVVPMDQLDKVESIGIEYWKNGLRLIVSPFFKGYKIVPQKEGDFVTIDIFGMSEVVRNDKLVYSTVDNHGLWKDEYFIKSDVYPLKMYKFEDLELPGPREYQEYLDRIYKDWKIKAPVRKYNFVIENSDYFTKPLNC